MHFDRLPVSTPPSPHHVDSLAFPPKRRYDVDDDADVGHGVKHPKLVVDEAGSHTPMRDWVDDAVVQEHHVKHARNGDGVAVGSDSE
jgi:hypothetical protein